MEISAGNLSDDLTRLFQQRRHQYVAFARSYVRDHDVAEDLFMDAMMAVWQSRATLAPDSNLPALLLTALRNKCLNHLERQRRGADVAEALLSQRELDLRIATLRGTNPAQVFSTEIQAIVEQTLGGLPEQSSRIFRMSRHRFLHFAEFRGNNPVDIRICRETVVERNHAVIAGIDHAAARRNAV